MNVARLKIDLASGVVDVEGSEAFVSAVYSDFKSKLTTSPVKPPVDAPSAMPHPPTPAPVQAKRARKPAKPRGDSSEGKPKKANTTPVLLKNLDLGGQGKTERLKDFYDKFAPTTNMERNLIFAYYLQNKVEMEGITPDHIFTCYRNVGGVKAPEALRQSLLDTAGRRGWLDVEDWDDIQVSISGVNYLEHDLPKKP